MGGNLVDQLNKNEVILLKHDWIGGWDYCDDIIRRNYCTYSAITNFGVLDGVLLAVVRIF